MKKKLWIPIAAAVVLAAVLFMPIPGGPMKDGGSREYLALTYKVIDWNKLLDNNVYDKTRIYFFPDNFKSIDKLWEREKDKAEDKLYATVTSLRGNTAVVEPLEGMSEWYGTEISFETADLEDIGAEVGSIVEVTYVGGLMETYPVQINAVGWQIFTDMRNYEYPGIWVPDTLLTEYDKTEEELVITRICANCFFARSVMPPGTEMKINGKLSDEWCVEDQVHVTFDNYRYDGDNNRAEADLLTIETSDFVPGLYECAKPVIYLYPEKETDVSVKLELDGDMTCTYPAYNNGWDVTAYPDGTLVDGIGQSYNYLYWEGETYARYDFSKGFCIKGDDTASFLEEALAKLGLSRREANEFIVYWLPLMQDNPYNIISFQTDAYADAAKLSVTPSSDTLIRVFMAWQSADSYTELEEQELVPPERNGFTVVEWGGTQVK